MYFSLNQLSFLYLVLPVRIIIEQRDNNSKFYLLKDLSNVQLCESINDIGVGYCWVTSTESDPKPRYGFMEIN